MHTAQLHSYIQISSIKEFMFHAVL